MGGICPNGRNAHANSCWRDKPLPATPNPPKTLPPFPSGWLVGVVAKYKGSGRSLKSCWHRGRGPGCLSFSPLSYLLSPPRAAVSPPPPPLISPSRGFVKKGRAPRLGWRGPGRAPAAAGRGCRGFRTGRP